MYELAFYQQYSIDIDKEDLRQFISIFSSMMSTSLPVPIENLHTVMTVVVGELKPNATDFDYNLYTLLFLITITSQVQYSISKLLSQRFFRQILLETSISDSERRVLYQFICAMNQHRYATQAYGSSLLHLSVNRWTIADDYSFDHMYKCVPI
jgi:hypothetical protein